MNEAETRAEPIDLAPKEACRRKAKAISTADARGCTQIYRAAKKMIDQSALRGMSIVKRADRFQLDHSGPLDQQVDRVLPNYDVVIPDGNPLLLHDGQARLAQFMSQGVRVNPMIRSDTRLNPPSSACICVHLRLKYLR
jgi:hypothetical protein